MPVKLLAGTVAALVAAALPALASAGIYTDDMTRCLVQGATRQDQEVLSRWMFTLFTASPVAAPLSKVTEAQRESAHSDAAQLMQRLLLVDCRAQTVSALKYEGVTAIETSFGVLGQVAVRSLMTDPAVAAEMQRFAAKVDETKMQALFAEAGLKPQDGAPASPAKR